MRPSFDDDLHPARDGREFYGTIDEGKMAAFLSFDKNTYRGGRVPCQMLAAAYSIPKLTFCVKGTDGEHWIVSKTQIKNLLESGRYVWVVSEEPVLALGELTPSLVVQSCESSAMYRPPCQRMYSKTNPINSLGPFNSAVKYSGRCRKYYEDGRMGVSRNLSNLPLDFDEERTFHDTEASAAALEEARSHARGF